MSTAETVAGPFPAKDASQAEAAIKLGDGTVSEARLKPYDNARVVTQRFKDGRVDEPGIWTDQLRLREIDGRKLFVRTQGFAYYNGKSISSINIFDPISMAPISSEQHKLDGRVEFRTIHGTHVESRVKAAPDGKDDVHEFDTLVPSYDFNCCMASLFPATLPLRRGYSGALPAIAVDKDDDKTVFYRVVGKETIAAGSKGKRDTWVIENASPGWCGCTIRLWISERPPFIIRMTLSPGPGHEYEQSFDMIP